MKKYLTDETIDRDKVKEEYQTEIKQIIMVASSSPDAPEVKEFIENIIADAFTQGVFTAKFLKESG